MNIKLTLSATDSFAIYSLSNFPLELTPERAVFSFACNEKILRLVGLYATHDEYMEDMSDKRNVLWFDKRITLHANGKLELYIAKRDDKTALVEVTKELVGQGADILIQKIKKKIELLSSENVIVKTNSTSK